MSDKGDDDEIIVLNSDGEADNGNGSAAKRRKTDKQVHRNNKVVTLDGHIEVVTLDKPTEVVNLDESTDDSPERVPAPPAVAAPSARIQLDREEFAGQEGRTLRRMTNVALIPRDWTTVDAEGRDIVVFGGDVDCVEPLEKQGARSVKVFKTFGTDDLTSQVLALTACFHKDEPTRTPEEGEPWPLWSEDVTVEGEEPERLNVLLKTVNAPGRTVVETITVAEMKHKDGKRSLKEEKTHTCGYLFLSSDFAMMTAEKYVLSSIRVIYRP